MYPPVNPILFQVGPFSLHWYGVIMTLAIFLGTLVASRYVTRHGRDGSVLWDMLMWVLIPAIVGARLYYVFIQSPRGPNGLQEYLAHPIEILQVWRGGIHIYGAILFGGIAAILFLRYRKLPLAPYLDGVGLGLLLGQAIGRLGNFINQELYGPPTTLPWGLRIDPDHRVAPYNDLTKYPESVRFHPLFLYEMVWDAIGFALILWISRRFAKQLKEGDVFLLVLIWSPLGRFFIEFLRTDSWFFPGTPFNTAHILTATLVIASSITLYLRHRRGAGSQTQSVEEETENGEHETATVADSKDDAEKLDKEQVSGAAKNVSVDVPSKSSSVGLEGQ